jgi:hypothetical protein
MKQNRNAGSVPGCIPTLERGKDGNLPQVKIIENENYQLTKVPVPIE